MDMQFNGPGPVILHLTIKEIYHVTDANNHRIQVFNPEGQFLQQFGIAIIII